MPRTTNNVSAHRRRKKYMLQARGYYGSRSKTYRAARQTVERAMAFSFAHRKQKKRRMISTTANLLTVCIRQIFKSTVKHWHILPGMILRRLLNW